MNIYEWQNYETYEGHDLGAVCTDGCTVFSLWSPVALKVTLRLYEDGDLSLPYDSRVLERQEHGVFRTVYETGLHGSYYDYELMFEGKSVVTADPYAKGCGINGRRSMVVDFAQTDPSGWTEDHAPAKGTEDMIYELHVKEFSWDKAGGFSKEFRGKYLAFTEAHTTLCGDGIHPTGLACLKELGVTHVQLMPVYDFGSVDEAGADDQFNWGYDPVNYFVPEGSYATDPFHGQVRIKELKAMVKSLHSSGFRVIMDVVFNHTYSADSWLERTVPGYYYRREADGTLSDGSGCGNDIASERPMCSNYILDCVSFWVEAYHMDGFRFDLMGLLDVALMNRIQEEMDKRYGRGEILIYGEPWAAAQTPMEPGSVPALRAHIKQLDEAVGVFCDGTRDAVKGHIFEAETPGFVNGGRDCEQGILHGITAWCDEGADGQAKAPSQIITYISAHDNLTLWDKLVLSCGNKSEVVDFYEKNPEILKRNRLAAAICLTCQGRPFMLSGEEFARTKGGLDNSYDASAEVNRLDWSRAYEYGALRQYYQGLIALRRQIPGLCDKSDQASAWIREKKAEGSGCISFLVDHGCGGRAVTCVWSQVFIIYHAGTVPKKLNLPKGDFEILADGENSHLWEQENRQTVSGHVVVEPVSALILGRSPA